MFKLDPSEDKYSLRSQIVTLNKPSNKKRGQHVKYAPIVFTEQGIAMLSSVLNNDRAISVNIQIIRIFTKLREMIDAYKELREKVEEMEKIKLKYDILLSTLHATPQPHHQICTKY